MKNVSPHLPFDWQLLVFCCPVELFRHEEGREGCSAGEMPCASFGFTSGKSHPWRSSSVLWGRRISLSCEFWTRVLTKSFSIRRYKGTLLRSPLIILLCFVSFCCKQVNLKVSWRSTLVGMRSKSNENPQNSHSTIRIFPTESRCHFCSIEGWMFWPPSDSPCLSHCSIVCWKASSYFNHRGFKNTLFIWPTSLHLSFSEISKYLTL